jgi:hypothetical protein
MKPAAPSVVTWRSTRTTGSSPAARRDWEQRLADLEAAKDELACRLEQRPHVLGQEERDRLLALGADLATVWGAPTTAPATARSFCELSSEVILSVDRDKSVAHLTLR